MRPPCEDLSETLAETRDSKLWGTDPVMRRKIFDVNVHPELGGWFAYRALVVLRGAGALGWGEGVGQAEGYRLRAEDRGARAMC